ncbi:MAG TPA: GatB/YqeY domain-containing protein [Bacteroidaceae bacterium]|nr:GatB/YqeY domain-containing protein [Bacteroidaceae bacterium]
MSLFDQVNEDMKAAMRAKDKVALAAIRNMKKLFLEAKTAPGANDELSDADAQKIVQKLVKQGKDSAAVFIEQNRQDLADEELAQVEVLSRYMPKQLTAEELDAAVREIITSVGAAGPKDMGKVMGAASKQLAGKAEGRAISEKVKEILASL